jgi:carbonic anhydrase
VTRVKRKIEQVAKNRTKSVASAKTNRPGVSCEIQKNKARSASVKNKWTSTAKRRNSREQKDLIVGLNQELPSAKKFWTATKSKRISTRMREETLDWCVSKKGLQVDATK